ncbi:MAG: hypothetical protein KY469_11665 [Actinobacteria bacterium]|nr:hypothetical protein [Actinomycetota bacterium]
MSDNTAERSPVAHRSDVVRRLLQRGVSPRTLLLVLPTWEPTITSASADPRP